MNLYMPKDGPPSSLGSSNALTVLLANNNSLYYYQGSWEDAKRSGAIYKTTFGGANGLRKIINERQAALDADPNNKEKRNGLMLLVKPSKNASYKNIVDVLDEVTINVVKKYALVKLTTEEAEWLESKK
jgi:hypothetical protein